MGEMSDGQPRTERRRFNNKIYLSANLDQCSQPSRGPAGPGGPTAKTPGPDGTAENVPSPSTKSKDCR